MVYEKGLNYVLFNYYPLAKFLMVCVVIRISLSLSLSLSLFLSLLLFLCLSQNIAVFSKRKKIAD